MEATREDNNKEEKEIFVSNVMQQVRPIVIVILDLMFDFSQTEGEERVLCGNQLASRVIELILPYASPSVSAR